MKRMFLFVLCLLLLLCSCDAGKDSPKVRQEMINACDLNEKDIEQIGIMFDLFDTAFENLKKTDSPTEEDFTAYAESVLYAWETFEDETFFSERISEKLEKAKADDPESEEVSELAGALLGLTGVSLILTNYDFMHDVGDKIGEAEAEKIFEAINEASQLFYGVDWIKASDSE